MPGTILAKLSATTQADGTTVTAANGGFSSTGFSIGSGNTFTHQSGSKMGEAEGYKAVQGGANQLNTYLDFAAQDVFAFRWPHRFEAAPAVSAVTHLRGLTATDHVTNAWSLAQTSTNRLNFIEGTSGGINISSASGTPLVANTDYVIMGLYNKTTSALTIRAFPRGSATALFELAGTLLFPLSIASLRYGISTASALSTIHTNDAFAVGYGDWLARTDITATPLSATVAVAPNTGNIPFDVTATVTASGGTGGAKTYAFNWGDGGTTAASSSNTATHTYATSSASQSGGTFTVTATVTEV